MMSNITSLTAAEVFLLVGLIGWAVGPLLTPKLARMFLRVWLALASLLALAVVGVAALAVFSPTALHVVTTLAVLSTAWLTWRNRVTAGASRALPPGSLSLRHSLAALTDRDFYLDVASRLGPVFKTSQFHQPVVCVVGLERAHRLLHEHADALGPSVQRFNSAIPKGFLRYMRDDTHDVYGPLFRQALSARVVTAHGAHIRRATQEALAALARDAAAHSGWADPEPCMERVVDDAFLAVLFGYSPNSEDVATLKQAYAPIARLSIADAPSSEALTALAAVRHLLAERTRRWRPDDTPACALSELARLHPGMPDDTCLDNLVFIYRISTSNVVGLLRWLLATVGHHPEWADRLRDDVGVTGSAEGTTLADRMIMETLRLSQAEYLYRRLREDVRFDGFLLPKGWLVRMCVAESHRSGDQFTDPGRFDPDRFLAREVPRTAYMPFGGDRHACNGVALTNVIARTFLEELSTAYDWTVDRAWPLEREFRHWSHWRPSRRMRLRLSPRRDGQASHTRSA